MSNYEQKSVENGYKTCKQQIIEANREAIDRDVNTLVSEKYKELQALVPDQEIISDRTLKNFLLKPKTTPNYKTVNQLCLLFLNMPFKEWWQKQLNLSDERGEDEYHPFRSWSGIIRVTRKKEPVNVIQDISNRFDRLRREQPQSLPPIKELWFYGVHCLFTMQGKEAEYKKFLTNGVALKFLINDYQSKDILELLTKKFDEQPDVIRNNCKESLWWLFRLMQWWKNTNVENVSSEQQVTEFQKKFAHQLQIRLHDNVASSKCYIVDPQNPEAISYVYPGVDNIVYYRPPLFICENVPAGMVEGNYFPGIKNVWQSARHLSLEDNQHMVAIDKRKQSNNHANGAIQPNLIDFYSLEKS